MAPWTIAHRVPLSMGFPRQEYWSGLPILSPKGLPNPGVEPRSPALQADALLTEIPGKPKDQWFNSMKKAMEERDCVGKNPLIVTMDWIWGLRKKKTSTIIDHQTIIMVCGWCDWVGRGFLEELGLLSRDPYWLVV